MRLDKIIAWITDPKNRTVILIAVIALLCIFIGVQRNKLKAKEKEIRQKEQNLYALQDSIQTYRTRNGDLVTSKGVLTGTLDELEVLNKELADKVKDQENKILALNNFIASFESETLYVDTTNFVDLGNDSYKFTWQVEQEEPWGSTNIEGYNEFGANVTVERTIVFENIETVITKNNIELYITTGFEEITEGPDKGKLRTFARTSNPNLQFTNLNGAILDPNMYATSNSNEDKPFFTLGVHGGGWVVLPYNVEDGLQPELGLNVGLFKSTDIKFYGNILPFQMIGVRVNYDLIKW